MIVADTLLKKKVAAFVYTNYKGQTSIRTVIPLKFYYGCTDYHTEEQWLLEAHDHTKNDIRIFAMKYVRCWL